MKMTIKIGDYLYGNKIFYRVNAHVIIQGKVKNKLFWAQDKWIRKNGGIGYRECNKFGQTRWKTKKDVDIKLIEIVFASKEDIIFEKKARMNLHYGELEIVGK